MEVLIPGTKRSTPPPAQTTTGITTAVRSGMAGDTPGVTSTAHKTFCGSGACKWIKGLQEESPASARLGRCCRHTTQSPGGNLWLLVTF